MRLSGVERFTDSTCAYTGWPRRIGRQNTVKCRATVAPTAEEQANSIQQLLTRRSYAPPRFLGPIKVSEVPGKRYGLIATQNLPVGALLLVVPPLVAAYGPAGAAPSNKELVSQLAGQQLAPWQLQWLRLLHRQPAAAATAAAAGTATAVPGGDLDDSGNVTIADDSGDDYGAASQLGSSLAEQQPPQQQDTTHCNARSSGQLALLQQLLLQGDAFSQCNTAAAAAGAATAAAGPGAAGAAGAMPVEIASICCSFTEEQLEQLIAENAYSEPSEDLGAALLRELDPEAITGLWPEYALLNHSCAPNTVAVVVGQYLLLRGTAPIMAGEELTGSYLGTLGFAPVAVRRAYLSGIYGFHCQCDRCMTEQSTFPTVYYPADNHLLGIVDPSKPLSNSNDNQQQQQQKGWFSKTLSLLGLDSSSNQQQKRLHPSQQSQLLVQLHNEAVDLQAAVQDAVTADSRRQERQLLLLQQITQKVDSLFEAVNDMVPQLQESSFVRTPQTAAKQLIAASHPLLQLQVELLELLLSSGEVPVDEKCLYDERNGMGTMPSGGSRGMAAAGAAATARLSLSGRGGKSSKPGSSGFNRVLSSWGFRPDDDAGPVTKRQLLGLYVEALERSLLVVDAVGRGSESHMVVALKHMDAARQLYGGQSDETRLAEGLCSKAHAARYGVLKGGEQQLLAALISARRRQLLGVSLARKMSVMAWEGTTARD